MLGGDGFSGLAQKFGGGRRDHQSNSSCSYETLFVGRKAFQTIDLCTRWTETELINSDFTNGIKLKSLADKISEIRQHPGYKPSIDILIQNEIELLEGIGHLMQTLFDETQCKRQTCYRALTLYVYTYDFCQMIKDNDIKTAIFEMVESTVENLEVDWSMLNDDIHGVLKWNIVKIFCLNLGLFLLNCFFFSFKSL